MHQVSPHHHLDEVALPRPLSKPPQRVPVAHNAPRFYWWHGGVPALAAVVVFGLWTAMHGDLWLADRLYAWEGQSWGLRHARITQQLVHLLGRDLSTAAWLGVLAAWLVACSRTSLTHLRKPLLYLLAATALSTSLVALTKQWSNMDCPWDLLRYGGARPFVALFDLRPAGLGRGVCFPAGHASAGYTWLALYFFLLVVKPRLRWYGLAVGLVFGLVFGISQQLRGAHFLSHDLAAAAICWFSALAMYAAFGRQPVAGVDQLQ
ncbi:MAG TPA: phosphatase PAP2 family protein [Lysobacter sp.]|nr:phosphatase PAP2 family protein [Lysobacter sp.]